MKFNKKEIEVLVSILNSVNLLASTHHYSDIYDIVENRLTPREINSLHEKLIDQLAEVA
jgi:hypothetical protein